MKKLQKAKAGMMLDEPFFADIMCRMEWVESKDCPTMGTDGKKFFYGTDFVEKISPDELKGVILHEVYHVILSHPFRRSERDPELWNIACDLAINGQIKSLGYKLPEGGLFPPDNLKDKSAEEIYKILQQQEENKDKKDGEAGDGDGDGKNKSPSWGKVFDGAASAAENKRLEKEMQVAVVQAAQMAKKAGKIPADIARLIAEITEGKVDWKEELKNFADERIREESSWMRPNKRYIPHGYYLPSLGGKTLGKVAISMDTSGSVTPKDLSEYGGESQAILDIYPVEMLVIYSDHKVAKVETFQKGDEVKFSPKGGGGTSFVPTFEYLEKENINPLFLIYFTDGYCDDYPPEPSFPVFWIINSGGTKDFKPPFGKVVHIKE